MWQTRLSGEICYSDSDRTADSKNRRRKQEKETEEKQIFANQAIDKSAGRGNIIVHLIYY